MADPELSRAEALMILTLAKADIEFAMAKCCQAEVDDGVSAALGGRKRPVEVQMGFVPEAAGRAIAQLLRLIPKDGPEREILALS